MAEGKLESRLIILLKEAKSLVLISLKEASFGLRLRRSKEPVKPVKGREVEFWTNCLLDRSDMPWYG